MLKELMLVWMLKSYFLLLLDLGSSGSLLSLPALLLLDLLPLGSGSLSLGDAVELDLLSMRLEAAVTHLGGSIDELELDLLESSTVGGRDDGLAEGEDTLLGTDAVALEHEEVTTDNTVVGEATHGGDALLGKVELGGTVAVLANTNTVDLLVHVSAVEVTLLTSTGYSPLNVGRVPGTDTSNLAVATVSLAGQLADAETTNDTHVTLTLGGTDHIDTLVLGEDLVDRDGLLKEADGKVKLLLNVLTTVDLDLHKVSLALTKRDLVDLGVSEHTDDRALLLHLLKSGLHVGVKVLVLGVLGESLPLAGVPVLVEATLALVGKVLSPDGGDAVKTGGGVLVADDTDDDHRRSLKDGHSLKDLLLVQQLAERTIDITNDVSHTGLVAHEGSQVAGLAGIILREGADLATRVVGTLAGAETQRTMTGSLKLAVRHYCDCFKETTKKQTITRKKKTNKKGTK